MGDDADGEVKMAQERNKLVFGANWRYEEVGDQECYPVELFLWKGCFEFDGVEIDPKEFQRCRGAFCFLDG